MANLLVGTALLLAVAVGSLSAQQQNSNRNCGIPNTIPGTTLDPSKTAGTWYGYMYEGPGPLDYNMMFTYIPIGTSSSTGTMPMNWMVSMSITEPTQVCMGMFAQSSFDTNGKKTSTVWMVSPMRPATPIPTVYTTLYTDYNTMEIVYRCPMPNNQTGMCDEPMFFVNTRLKPAMLSQATKNLIQTTVNRYLSPYCYSTQSLQMTGWNEALPPCNPTAPTQRMRSNY